MTKVCNYRQKVEIIEKFAIFLFVILCQNVAKKVLHINFKLKSHSLDICHCMIKGFSFCIKI